MSLVGYCGLNIYHYLASRFRATISFKKNTKISDNNEQKNDPYRCI